MNCVSFQNPGILDLRAATTFGVNVKENTNPIGFFGTGLKYALAILLRTGHRIEVWRGMERHKVEAVNLAIRGKTFDIVCLDGKELGFTTEVGKNWALWTALRELECNVKDEAGFSQRAELSPQAGMTTIRVYGNQFYNEYEKYDEIFLPKGAKALWRNDHLEVYQGGTESVYYRGVKASTLSKPSIYTYNLLDSLELTEDRTIKHAFFVDYRIAGSLLLCNEERPLQYITIASKDHYEHNLPFADNAQRPDETFMSVVAAHIKAKNPRLTRQAREAWIKSTPVDMAPYELVELSQQFRADLEWSLAIMRKLGMNPDRYPIQVVESIGENVLGRADRAKNDIKIAVKCFHIGRRMVASTLIEEYIHLAHGLDDFTRGFQDFVLDLLLQQIDKDG